MALPLEMYARNNGMIGADDADGTGSFLFRRLLKLGGDDDVSGYDDDDSDLDVSGCGASPEDEIAGDDDPGEVGAKVDRIKRKLRRNRANQVEVSQRMQRARPRRQERLRRKLEQLKRDEHELEAQLKSGKRRNAHAANQESDSDAAGDLMQTPNGSMVTTRHMPAAVEVPLVVNFAGSPILIINVAAGAGLRTTAITGTTQPVSYAKYRVRGLEYSLQVSQAADQSVRPELLPNIICTNINVDGDMNLLYTPMPLQYTGLNPAGISGDGLGGTNGRRGTRALRKSPIIDPTNFATIQATFRQEITTTTAFSVSLSMALIVDVIYDKLAYPSSR